MTRAVGLPGGVDVAGVLALHPPVLVVQARLNHPVPDSLEHKTHIDMHYRTVKTRTSATDPNLCHSYLKCLAHCGRS